MKINLTKFIRCVSLSPLLLAGMTSAADWQRTTNYLVAGSQFDPVVSGNHLYVAGGFNNGALSNLFVSATLPSGGLQGWVALQDLPAPDQGPGVAVANGHLYVALSSGAIWRAPIGANGTLGSWISEPSVDPTTAGYHGALKAYKSNLYLFGRVQNGVLNTIRVAPIQGDGSLGAWTSTSFPAPVYGAAIQFFNDRVYAAGGLGVGDFVLPISYSAGVSGQGVLTEWRSEATLPVGVWAHTSVVVSNKMYLFGGLTNAVASATIYEGEISATDGAIANWSPVGSMPGAFSVTAGAVYSEANGHVYLVGGADGLGGLTSDVWTRAFGSVPASNTAPVATPQTVTTAEGAGVAITLKGSDADGDALSFEVVAGPTNGTLTGSAPTFTYAPNSAFSGVDGFTFRVSDGRAYSDEARVMITVVPANRPPVANGQSVTVGVNTLKAITLTGSDADSDPLVYEIVTGPTNGTLAGTPPQVTYSPNADYLGTDTFTFKVNDGGQDSALATVSIEVVLLNLPPQPGLKVGPLFGLAGAGSQIISDRNGQALVTLDGSASTDPDEDALEFQWYEGSILVGEGRILRSSFSTGKHTVTLRVNDGTVVASADTSFEVISAENAVGELIAAVQSSAVPKQRKQGLLASLNAAGASLSRGNFTPAIGQLGAVQQKLQAQIARENPALARQWSLAAARVVRAIR